MNRVLVLAACLPAAVSQCPVITPAEAEENSYLALCQYSNCLRANCENFNGSAFEFMVPTDMLTLARALMKCSTFVTGACDQQIGQIPSMSTVAEMTAGTDLAAVLNVSVGEICALRDDPDRIQMNQQACCFEPPETVDCQRRWNTSAPNYVGAAMDVVNTSTIASSTSTEAATDLSETVGSAKSFMKPQLRWMPAVLAGMFAITL